MIATAPASPAYRTMIVAIPTSAVRCNHCARTVFEIVGNCIVLTERHDSQYHKTVISLDDLGLMWKPNA